MSPYLTIKQQKRPNGEEGGQGELNSRSFDRIGCTGGVSRLGSVPELGDATFEPTRPARRWMHRFALAHTRAIEQLDDLFGGQLLHQKDWKARLSKSITSAGPPEHRGNQNRVSDGDTRRHREHRATSSGRRNLSLRVEIWPLLREEVAQNLHNCLAAG